MKKNIILVGAAVFLVGLLIGGGYFLQIQNKLIMQTEPQQLGNSSSCYSSDGQWRGQNSVENLFVFVNGARSSGEFADTAEKVVQPLTFNYSIESINKGHAKKNGKAAVKTIKDFIKNNKNVCELNIVVATHSIGAVGVFNMKDSIEGAVENAKNDVSVSILYYDPPYDEKWSKDPLFYFFAFLWSDVREIRKARNNNIKYESGTIIWTDGYEDRGLEDIVKEHNKFIGNPSVLGLIRSTMESLNRP
jgi:hypothetical protein